MAEAPSTKVNFTGTWKLLKTDNQDTFLDKSEGMGWVKRKAAAAMGITQTIEHDPDTGAFKIKIVSTVGSPMEYSCKIGSDESYTFKDLMGTEIVGKMVVSEDGSKLIETLTRDAAKKDPQIFTRYMSDDGSEMLLDIHNEIKAVRMLRHFKKTG